jgi:hypothetical protein
MRIRRVGWVVLMAVLTANIWTGGPLLALWIGSRAQGSGSPTMGPIVLTAISLGVISFVLIRLLAIVDERYGQASGRTTSVRRHVPWLRSMRGERPHDQARFGDLSPLEILLVAMVVLVIALFEVWFFFYSGSPIDGRTGRSHEAPIIGMRYDPGTSRRRPAPPRCAAAGCTSPRGPSATARRS